MRNEKTFFKWSFGLRFLFVFLCAIMCVGNAWGANWAQVRLYSNTDVWGKVNKVVVTDGSTPTTPASTATTWVFRNDSTKSSGTGAYTYNNVVHGNFEEISSVQYTKNTYSYSAYAKVESGCQFVRWEIYNGTSKIASTDMDTVSTTLTGGINRLTITKIKGNSTNMPIYWVKAIFKTNTKTITCDQPTNGTYTVNDGATTTNVPNATSFQITPGSSVTLTATPTTNGYYFYRWYYKDANGTHNLGTTNPFEGAIPNTATAIGAEFKRRKEFKVAPYQAGFTGDDYKINISRTLHYDITTIIAPSITDTISRYLYEGESVDFGFDYSTTTTRGVQYNRWYYKKGGTGTEYGVTTNVDYHLTYNTLVNNISGIPVFAVDVERKDTLTVKYVSSPYGAYTSMFCDSNGGSNHGAGYPHPDLSKAGGNFTISAGNTETTKQLYADDMIRLLRTSSQHNATANGYVFQTWYWEDAEGFQYPLGEGRDSTSSSVGTWKQYLETFLPEGAVKVGAHIVEAHPRSVRFMANSKGTYHVKATTYTGTAISSQQFDMTTSTNHDVTNWLPSGYVTLSNPTCNDPEHYVFYRWYYVDQQGIKKTIAYLKETVSAAVPDADSIGVEFQPIANFTVSGLYFDGLADAVQAAQSEVNSTGSATIVVARDATVTAGNYTIPANVTLLIPYEAGQIKPANLRHVETSDIPTGAYRTLTLADGAHLEVYGTIEVSGCQTTGGGDGKGDQSPSRTAAPYYGQMHMNGGSSITMNNGSKLYAWGFVTGDRDANKKYTCEIDVRRGATVYEHFQIGDWKGTFPTVEITKWQNENAYHVLPICQYYIQNVEVPARYRPGSRLLGAASINANILDQEAMGVTFAMNDAGLVGIKYPEEPAKSDNAVFLLNDADNSEDTWVRKFYDPATDQQVYEINNSADVGSLVMKVVIKGIGGFIGGDDEINVDSRGFQFPIMNNFKMHLLSGEMFVTQRTEILPGAVIEVDKKSTLTINGTNDAALLFYDADDWGQYIFQHNTGGEAIYDYGSRVKYRPGGLEYTRKLAPAAENGLEDAQLIVHGTVDVKGTLMTTSHGASIVSTIEDAGTVKFSKTAPATAGNTYQVSGHTRTASHTYTASFTAIPRVPALLRNDANNTAYGATTSTASTPKDTSYCFIDMNGDGKGEWINLANDGCFVRDQYGNYYAKPKEYVALANGKTANEDHTYSDKAGQGRLFILTDDCQWWEVEKKDNLYHCINPDNDTYYYWGHDYMQDKDRWMEKVFQIFWVNWDGSYLDPEHEFDVYRLNYGVTPKYLEDENPTRPDDVDYTYTFVGWTPEIVPVTGDATYTAVYEAIQKKYTIIFNDQNGEEIERQQLALGETPSVPDISSIENSYWNPAIAVVSGNATYQVATTPLAKYTVTWANYNGTPIYSEEVNNDGEQVPAYNKATAIGHTGVDAEGTPVKNLNNEYNYTWTGWQSPAGTYDTDDELPEVKANITYTATFSVDPKKYNINFYDVNNNQLGSTQNLAFGADPVVPNYSQAATAQYTYTLKWYDVDVTSDPEEEAMVNVPTVTRDASYKAYFTETLNKYTVTLQSNLPGKCSFTGAGTYDYDTNVTIAATPADGYEFVKWIEREGGANLGTLPLTSDITLTAVLKESAAATPENLNVNNGEINVPAAAPYMDLTIFSDGAETSGQLTGANNISLYGNANFVFKKNIKAGYWYSFAVPWRVDAQSGVYFGGSNTPAVLGKDFEIVYYDGAVRAAQGKVDACWVYLKNLSTKKILEPGKAYMIFIKHGSQSQIVFRKKVQEPLLTTSVNVTQYNASDVLNANWNAIANPALYSAYVYAGDGDPKGYYYISENDQFDWYHLNAEKLVVGEAVYIQAPEAGTIVVNNSSYAPVAAPRRERAEQATSFDVQIAAAGATKRADHISIQIDEDKEENKYVIGKDLTKFGVSARVAQMWIDRYDVKLSFNTIAPEGDATSFPMSIYAPKAGTYTIAIEREMATKDYALYLTYNGEAIWNLSEGAYTANLNKGTDANYGLRISAKAPQVVTGVDEAVVEAKGETRKVLINNQVFIIRGEKVYTIDGQLVK